MLLRPGLMGLNFSAGDPSFGETATAAAFAGAGAGAAAKTVGGAAAGSTGGAGDDDDDDDDTPFSRLVLSEAGATLSLSPLDFDLVKASGITILPRGPNLGVAASLLVPPLVAMFRSPNLHEGHHRQADWGPVECTAFIRLSIPSPLARKH